MGGSAVVVVGKGDEIDADAVAVSVSGSLSPQALKLAVDKKFRLRADPQGLAGTGVSFSMDAASHSSR